MNIEVQKILRKLLEDPLKTNVDHLSLLNTLYQNNFFQNKELQPIMNYYFNGLDDLPSLKEKELWNEDKFHEERRPFVESFPTLKRIVEDILRKAE